jgi:hypothetical protein
MSDAPAGAAIVLRAVTGWQAESSRRLVIAIDGHGAAGKTTLADELARALHAHVLHTDDYLHPARVSADTRPMAQYYDWERLRGEATLPLRGGDEVASPAPGTASPTPRAAAPLLIEGVSSAGPALADLVTHAVYVDTPEPLRLERLHTRIAPEEWDEDWLEAERVYFASRPPESFDLVVSGTNITA